MRTARQPRADDLDAAVEGIIEVEERQQTVRREPRVAQSFRHTRVQLGTVEGGQVG
jgi:hypothetical protein